MKKIRLSILLAAFVVFSSNAQTNFQKLKSAIESAPAVVEGKIIRQSSFQDEKTGNIFTKNYLWPTTLFKGIVDRDTVTFLTRGGRVGDIISTVSHTVQVSQNQEGIFLLHPSRAISNQYEISSYIERLTYDREFEAYFEGGHEKYPSWRFMREEIGRICGNDVTVERITSSELLLLDIPEFCVKLANPVLDAINKKVTFDVKAKSNIAGLEFARADIPLKYPQELLGSNIVLNGKVEAVKAESTNTSFYDLNIHDIVDDKFMLTLSSSCNAGESGFVLGTEFEKIAKVTVEVQEYGDLGTINAESFDVDGFAKYFLDGACQEFVEKCAEGQVPLIACSIVSVETEPFASGRGQRITFTGLGFGSGILDSLFVPNANDDGETMLGFSSASNHVELWEDSLLVMNLASIVDPTYLVSTDEILGSGLWKIEPFFPMLPCEVEVEIDYSLFATTVAGEFRTFGLAQADSITSGGTRNWYIVDGIDSDTSLTNYGITHEKVESVAKAAFCDWEKETGINFEYKGIVPSHSSDDDKYTIYFQNLGIGTLMFSDVRRQFYICDSSEYLGGRIIDGDFAVNSHYPWFFNHEDTIGLGSSFAYDFYSVLLHEIGHSLGLEHSMDLISNGYYDTRTMYYRDTIMQDRRTIDDKSINGVKWLIEKTTLEIYNPNGCFSNGFTISTSSASASCNSTTPNENIAHIPCKILVNKVVTIGDNLQLEGDIANNQEVTIFSVTGQPILRVFLSNEIRVPVDLSVGMYFLQWKCNGKVYIDKFIVQ